MNAWAQEGPTYLPEPGPEVLSAAVCATGRSVRCMKSFSRAGSPSARHWSSAACQLLRLLLAGVSGEQAGWRTSGLANKWAGLSALGIRGCDTQMRYADAEASLSGKLASEKCSLQRKAHQRKARFRERLTPVREKRLRALDRSPRSAPSGETVCLRVCRSPPPEAPPGLPVRHK